MVFCPATALTHRSARPPAAISIRTPSRNFWQEISFTIPTCPVERMQKEVFLLKGRVVGLEEKDFARKAEELAGTGDVLLVEGPMSGESLRKLCGLVKERCGGRCAVFAGENGSFQKRNRDQILSKNLRISASPA